MFKITNSIKKKKIKDSLTFPLQPKEYVVDLFFFAWYLLKILTAIE